MSISSLPTGLVRGTTGSPFCPVIPPSIILAAKKNAVERRIFPFGRLAQPFSTCKRTMSLSGSFEPGDRALQVASVVSTMIPTPATLVRAVAPVASPLTSSIPAG